MASNGWSPQEKHCENCKQEIGEEIEENVYRAGLTIEDEEGNMVTLCEDCLRALTRLDWEELVFMQKEEE